MDLFSETTLEPCPNPGKKERKSHIWAKDPHDYYVEPRWCSERLFAIEKFEGAIHDPSCGSGRIVKEAFKAGYHVTAADIAERAAFKPDHIRNFLSVYRRPFDNIVTNPPFRQARQFVEVALDRTECKVVMLLPAIWVCGDDRSRWLATTPLRRILYLTPRPSMPPGAVIEAGIEPGGGREDYAWYIWDRGFDGKPELGWCRRDA